MIKTDTIGLAMMIFAFIALVASCSFKEGKHAESRARCVEAMRDRSAVEIVAACGEVRK